MTYDDSHLRDPRLAMPNRDLTRRAKHRHHVIIPRHDSIARSPLMTVRPIVRYPDRRLGAPARPVTVFDDTLRELANDLLDTMRDAPGIGITAPHIGVPLRVVVLELDARDGV